MIGIMILIISLSPTFASAQQKQDESKDADFYTKRGISYYQKGEYDQAILDFDKALQINPMNAEAYNNRGSVYGEKGRYDQAISDFCKALEISPMYAEAYYNRGVTYNRRGQSDQAILDFEKALEINPRLAEAYYSRGLVYDGKGQYDQAISDYNKAIEINPRFVNPYNEIAWLLATAKASHYRDGKKALELSLKACELSEWKTPNYLDTLAAAYARVGDFDNAVRWQKKVLESPEFSNDKAAQQRLNLYRSHKAWPPD